MPELPEVESVRRSASRCLLGRTVIGVRLHRPDIVQGDTRPRALLMGATVASIERRGKLLAILATDGRALAVHLGMSGQLLCLPPGATPQRTDHVHAEWRLGDPGDLPAQASRMLFRDPRRFGGLWTYPSARDLYDDRWAALGPDAATVTADDLSAALARSARSLKAALLDQTALAGVGNIYADEALFAAALHPLRPCSSLTPDDWGALALAIRRVLADAIDAGGSTLRDYRDASGGAGAYQTRHLVYGRAGKPCMKCSSPLVHLTVAQRTTVACPRCQH